MITYRTTVTCLAGCGELGTGLSTDAPTTKRPPNWKGPYGDGAWTRWDELDRLAEKHPHATRTDTGPVTAAAA